MWLRVALIPWVHVHERCCQLNFLSNISNSHSALLLCTVDRMGLIFDTLTHSLSFVSLSLFVLLNCPLVSWIHHSLALSLLSFFIISLCPHSLFMTNATLFLNVHHSFLTGELSLSLNKSFLFSHHTLTFISFINTHQPLLFLVMTIKTHKNSSTCCTHPIHATPSFSAISHLVFLTFTLAAPLATPSCEGLLLQDNAVSAEIRALLSSYYNDRWSKRSRAI